MAKPTPSALAARGALLVLGAVAVLIAASFALSGAERGSDRGDVLYALGGTGALVGAGLLIAGAWFVVAALIKKARETT